MNSAMQELLKRARKNAGLKQSELAAQMAIQPTTISNWEVGKSSPDIDSLVQYCKLCGADYAAMLKAAYGDPTQEFHSVECTDEEIELIRKFRTLDARGKRVVTRNLDAEYYDVQKNK